MVEDELECPRLQDAEHGDLDMFQKNGKAQRSVGQAAAASVGVVVRTPTAELRSSVKISLSWLEPKSWWITLLQHVVDAIYYTDSEG